MDEEMELYLVKLGLHGTYEIVLAHDPVEAVDAVLARDCFARGDAGPTVHGVYFAQPVPRDVWSQA